MKSGSVVKSVLMFLAAVISLSVSAGCIVQSVNPFYGKESLSDLSALYGKWILKESGADEGLNKEWTFSANTISLPDTKSGSFALSSRFFKIDDMLFLDAIADAPPDGISLWWVLHITPLHTVSRVIADDKTMKIIPLKASWMEDAVKNKTVLLPSVWHSEQNSYLFTATAAEWTEFLKKYGKDPNVFSEKDALIFRRP